MGPERRRGLVLMALVVVLGIALYRVWPSPVGTSGVASGGGGGTRAAQADGPETGPDVRLDALSAERPKPTGSDRNLFRFERATSSLPPTTARLPVEVARSAPPPPSVPPIPLKFIGIVEAPERALKIAVLSDGRGVYYGREGEIVEGRYRIWRIGAESIELSQLDGSGRQMIRLSGS